MSHSCQHLKCENSCNQEKKCFFFKLQRVRVGTIGMRGYFHFFIMRVMQGHGGYGENQLILWRVVLCSKILLHIL